MRNSAFLEVEEARMSGVGDRRREVLVSFAKESEAIHTLETDIPDETRSDLTAD